MHVLSFDIEDWYLTRTPEKPPPGLWDSFESRVERNSEVILGLLEKHRVKATFFVLGWIAEKYPGLVRKIRRKGHEMGYHSYYHTRPCDEGAAKFDADLKKGLGLLESILGEKVVYYRAPFFSCNGLSGWLTEVLMKNGIQVSSSVKAYSESNGIKFGNAPVIIENGEQKIIELPLSRINLAIIKPVISGSGYFRLLPLSIHRKYYHNNKYSMTYFHPRDFDDAVPFSNMLPFSRNILNKSGIGNTVNKLDSLMEKFEFVCFDQARKMVEESPDRYTIIAKSDLGRNC